MTIFISPSGNPEIWDEKPNGYFTEAEWLEAHKGRFYSVVGANNCRVSHYPYDDIAENEIEVSGPPPDGTYLLNEKGEWEISEKLALPVLKAAKLNEINSACDAILNAAVNTYPETEVLTFDQQTSEAKAYQASGNVSDAPLLSALATSRGIRLDNLVQRVIAKHNAFSALSGCVIGQRQALEDMMDACATVDEIEAITVNITLPETENAATV